MTLRGWTESYNHLIMYETRVFYATVRIDYNYKYRLFFLIQS